jgi:formamidopyrimidine-DNA glycosylase
MMPELPEVETVRQTLRQKVIGKTIISVEVLYDKMIKTDLNIFKEQIRNQQILEVERMGKYLLFKLDHSYLISHLRMEGKYFLRNTGQARNKHDHLIFYFSDGTELRYNDVRKFGTMHLKSHEQVYLGEPLEKLGYEPFDDRFDLTYMKKRFNKQSPIKNVLLDQTIVVGLGNIYVNEVLFRTRLNPSRAANSLTEGDLQRIKDESILVLRKAIQLGGTTIRSYYADDGITGLFQNELLVHDKKDMNCPNCQQPIVKMKVGGRGTYYCPNCQQ